MILATILVIFLALGIVGLIVDAFIKNLPNKGGFD